MAAAGYRCECCGEWHDELPFAWHFEAPVHWTDDAATHEDSFLGPETCSVRGEHFFIRGVLPLPVAGSGERFEWGVWSSLSPANFERAGRLWTTTGRETEPPYSGWLSTALPYESTTVSLPVWVHTQRVGLRPVIELDRSVEHLLAREQREGIDLARVQEIATVLEHPGQRLG
jgi:hypothetical protein